MSALAKPLKKTMSLPGKNTREKVDPFNLFLPKDPEDPLAPIPGGGQQSSVETPAANAVKRNRAGYMFGSGLSQGVRG
ncbi:MAG TPA: hypothetical protein VM512_14055 [Burkholderiaceae bacterium]|nr:hypothetical protein [Burkholderiaceae bacterium]